MSRGNRRTAIFQDHADYLYFLELVSKVKGLYPFKIHSLCLMSNHFHMSLETMDTELWKIMQKILSVYAEEFNLNALIDAANKREEEHLQKEQVLQEQID